MSSSVEWRLRGVAGVPCGVREAIVEDICPLRRRPLLPFRRENAPGQRGDIARDTAAALIICGLAPMIVNKCTIISVQRNNKYLKYTRIFFVVVSISGYFFFEYRNTKKDQVELDPFLRGQTPRTCT